MPFQSNSCTRYAHLLLQFYSCVDDSPLKNALVSDVFLPKCEPDTEAYFCLLEFKDLTCGDFVSSAISSLIKYSTALVESEAGGHTIDLPFVLALFSHGGSMEKTKMVFEAIVGENLNVTSSPDYYRSASKHADIVPKCKIGRSAWFVEIDAFSREKCQKLKDHFSHRCDTQQKKMWLDAIYRLKEIRDDIIDDEAASIVPEGTDWPHSASDYIRSLLMTFILIFEALLQVGFFATNRPKRRTDPLW